MDNTTSAPEIGTSEYSRQLVDQAKKLGVTGAGVDALSKTLNPSQGSKTTPVSPVIDASSVSNSSGSVVIPQLPPSTLAEGVTGKSSALLELYKTESTKAAEAEKKVAEGDKAVRESFDKIEEIEASRAKLEEEKGIPALKETARKAADSLLVSQRAQTNELRAIEKDPNISLDVKQQAQSSVNRKYAFEQADLQLTYHLANSDFNAAEGIINDKIKLQLEPEMRKLDQLKYFADRNWDTFTNADKRAFEVKKFEIEKDIESKENNLNKIGEIQLELAKLGKTIPATLLSKYADGSLPATDLLTDLGQRGISLAKPSETSAPTVKAINGVDMQWNPSTGKWETIKTDGAGGTLQLAQAQEGINLVSTIALDKNIRTAVGPSKLARFVGAGWDRLTGGRQNFIASVEQLRSQLTLDSLIQAKAKGATFGALSEGELKALSASASKLGSWAKKDGEGNVVAYAASEKDFKKELDKINNFAKLDFLIKGGDPTAIGVQEMPDGSLWSQNSDGSLTQLR